MTPHTETAREIAERVRNEYEREPGVGGRWEWCAEEWQRCYIAMVQAGIDSVRVVDREREAARDAEVAARQAEVAERQAEIVYLAMLKAAASTGIPRSWSPGGNSEMQNEARRTVQEVLAIESDCVVGRGREVASWVEQLEHWALDRMAELGPQPDVTHSDRERYAWAGKATAYDNLLAYLSTIPTKPAELNGCSSKREAARKAWLAATVAERTRKPFDNPAEALNRYLAATYPTAPERPSVEVNGWRVTWDGERKDYAATRSGVTKHRESAVDLLYEIADNGDADVVRVLALRDASRLTTEGM